MARKYKPTGCARIFVVLLIVAPIAFFAASYINNSDPFETLSNWFGQDSVGERVETQKTTSHDDHTSLENEGVADFEAHMSGLKKDLEYYKAEAEKYRKRWEECRDSH